MKNIKITENKTEIAKIGREIAEEKKDIYTPLMLEKMMDSIKKAKPDYTLAEKEEMLYGSIYNFWVYGSTIDEELYLNLTDKTHEEKKAYATSRMRLIYMDYLCCGGVCPDPALRKERINLLEDKYRCYKRLEPYYKREIIEIKDNSDYETFENFVKRHNEFVVKPSDYCYGVGVHKVNIEDFKSCKEAFDSILAEGAQIKERHPSKQSSIVIEELIVQSEALAKLHPTSINGIRASAVRDKNGNIVIHHPWIKCGVGGQFVASAALDGFDAEIDADTGIIISDGYSENGSVYELHPDTKVRIKGYQLPAWDELKELVSELMAELPDYGFIGWDLVHTDKGWVVMEANYAGEFCWQFIWQKGAREEFEDLIGFSIDADYWWQLRPIKSSEK